MSDNRRSMWLLSIIELPRPLVPGDRIADTNGHLSVVYEIRRLKSVSSPIAGRERTLYAVLHSGAGSIIAAVLLRGRQRQWAL